MNAGKTSAGSRPAARTSPVVYGETVRTPSARRRAASATRSATGESTRRNGDPYSRVDVRQSPCTSTSTGVLFPTAARAASAAAAS